MKKKNGINRALAAKKLYVSPAMEISNLLAMDVTMQHAFSSASVPGHMGEAPKRRFKVF